MADNTVINAGAGGDEIATDDIAGVKHQRIKVEYGDDGEATDVSETNPMPVGGDILEGIAQAVLQVAGAKGIASDLRVTIVGGTTAVTGSLTSVTTVGTVTNQAQIGGLIAIPFLQGQANQSAILSNINNVIVT